jgi:beta-galactosidase
LAYCGDIDICGWKRPQSYYRDALWQQDQIALFVKPPTSSFDTNLHKINWSRWEWHDVRDSWNWEAYKGQPLEVSVYSSYAQVELFLNGRSLGSRETNRNTRFTATWKVPYEAGMLTAKASTGKKRTGIAALTTAGKAAQVKLSVDKPHIIANGQDLSYITVSITDEKGVLLPDAEQLVQFEVTGPGTIAGVGNANPMSLESYQLPQRKTWRGKCLVIIKAGKQSGDITVKATVDGLPVAQTTILSRPE